MAQGLRAVCEPRRRVLAGPRARMHSFTPRLRRMHSQVGDLLAEPQRVMADARTYAAALEPRGFYALTGLARYALKLIAITLGR